MLHNPVKTGYKVQQMYKLPAFEDKHRSLSVIKDKEIKKGEREEPTVGWLLPLHFLNLVSLKTFSRVARFFKSDPNYFKEWCFCLPLITEKRREIVISFLCVK